MPEKARKRLPKSGHRTGRDAEPPVYKLTFHVPESHLEVTKAAVFAAGAGSVGNYDQCCWQVLGQGQVRPLTGSSPHQGEQGRVERTAEYRVELVCDDDRIADAVAALKGAHPYETPSYAAWKIETF